MVTSRSSAFQGARLRIRWAKESLANFERSARLYYKRAPYGRVVEPDPDGIHERHKLKLYKPLPASLTKNTIRTVENLRSALDLMAVAIARLLNVPLHNVAFPFSKTASDFKGRLNSCCKGFPKEITRLWHDYEPYGRTDNILFAINEICNTSKHRIIVPVSSKAGIRFPYIQTVGGARPLTIFEGVWDSEENEITYAITECGLKWKHRVQIAMGVFFGDVGGAAGYEVEPNLRKMIASVATIVDETEIECRKLGLL
jgi:hypothetical protein